MYPLVDGFLSSKPSSGENPQEGNWKVNVSLSQSVPIIQSWSQVFVASHRGIRGMSLVVLPHLK